MNSDIPRAPSDRVLVVDDDPGIRRLLISALGFAGFTVDAAGDLPETLGKISRQPPDAIVLDLMLPGADGFEILRLLRDSGVTVPVLFLTARDAIEDRVQGLRLGGDDYVTKPFSVVEVGARLEALLRRSRGHSLPEEPLLRCGDLTVDDKRHEVRRGNALIELSPTEYRLLHYLLTHKGQVVSRAQILEGVWQYSFGGNSLVVERFISNLRRKIEKDGDTLLHTVRGVGYTLREPVQP
ncbi:response regulator transcription factor [Streptomyces sp. NPDC048179]|uniref:response regulator transcription factor n=1 Tax=Streptomyces sp. NPDC048179 TaxID=3365506 RepID=UPI0037178CBF